MKEDCTIAIIPDWDDNGELTGEYFEVKESEVPPAPGWMGPGAVSRFLLGNQKPQGEPGMNRAERRLKDKKKKRKIRK